ncbi:RNA recognition motif domain [Dillenia turbinata]|uniref:RNA recognition motif domain n=1 Tax=Dillenia turbinata TaxID=194707 RepID=A0AAN8ZMI4_9MAGN
MAFASVFRRVLSSTPSTLPSQYTSLRLNTTLTSPKLFISGLNRMTTSEKLQEAFASFGSIVEGRDFESKVITDRMSGRSKGFGFITYETVEEAEKAREQMNAKFLDGWVIFVDPAKPREPRPPPPQPQPESQASDIGFRTNKTIGWCG